MFKRLGRKGLRVAVVVTVALFALQPVPLALGAKPPAANPVLTSLSASNGAPGTTLVLTGSGFGVRPSGDDVVFGGGVTGATYSEWTDTRISVVVPTGAQQGGVYVSVNRVASGSLPFTPWDAPTLGSVSPSPGRIGSQVTLSGAGFGATRGTSLVTFAGVTASVVSWSDTAITVTVPSAPAGDVVVDRGGLVSNAVPFTPVGPPAITSLSISEGELGAPLTVSGTDFGAVQGLSTVTFNGVPATVTSWSDTAVTVLVAGDGPVVVTCDGVASNAAAFTLQTAPVVPVITGVSPSPARVGTGVTVSGTGFGVTQGASMLAFDGVPATVTSWSDAAIDAIVPGDGPVVVTVDGNSSNAFVFSAVPAPAITSLSISEGELGAPLTVSGTDFGAVQGLSTVTFNGVPATVTSWSDTAVTVLVAGDGPVVVTCDGVESNAAAFTLQAAPVVPVIVAVAPSPARVGTGLTVHGAGFGPTQGASVVVFNGVPAPVASWSETAIDAIVPGGGPVVVIVGGYVSNAATFTAVPPPAITSLSVSEAQLGDPLTVSGTDFGAVQGLSTVTFNGVPATVTSWSDTAVTVLVAGDGPVVVTCDGVASNAAAFTLQAVSPTIASLSASSAELGSVVTVSGADFGATQGSGFVTFNGVGATVVSWSDTAIEVAVPGSGPVCVTQGGVESNSVPFTSYVSPRIDSLSAASGRIGSVVTISGANFGTSQGASGVTFSGVPADVFSWSPTAVEVIVPDAPAGNVVVTVGGRPSNAAAFTPVPYPHIASLSATSAEVGDQITITGTDFGATQGDGEVHFGETVATIVSWSDTSVTAIVADNGPVSVFADHLESNQVAFMLAVNPVVTALSKDYAIVGDVVTITGTGFGSSGSVVVAGVPVPHLTWSDTSVTFQVPGFAQGYVGIRRNGVTSNGIWSTHAPRVDSVSPWWAAPGSTVTLTGVSFGSGADGWVTIGGRRATVVSWSDTSVSAIVPSDAAGNCLVGVVRGYWATSNGKTLVVTTQARIDSLSATQVLPGQSLTISGSSFGVAGPNNKVLIGGTLECPVTSWSDTAIVVTVPQAITSGYLGVYKAGVPSNGVWVQRTTAAPAVATVSSWYGVPGTQVTITGIGFGSEQASGYPVFAGVPAEVVSWSDTSVTAIVPAGAVTGYVGIAQNGTVSNGLFFMPYTPPAISGCSTSAATVGTRVTITGSGFRTTQGSGRLTLAGVAVTPVSWSDTAVEFDVPAGAVSGYVGVTQDGKTSNGWWLGVVQ